MTTRLVPQASLAAWRLVILEVIAATRAAASLSRIWDKRWLLIPEHRPLNVLEPRVCLDVLSTVLATKALLRVLDLKAQKERCLFRQPSTVCPDTYGSFSSLGDMWCVHATEPKARTRS